jgi:hypothetical protein
MYATTTTSNTLTSRPKTTTRETTRTKLLQAVTATCTATEQRTYADVSAWARHVRAANGFGDAAID